LSPPSLLLIVIIVLTPWHSARRSGRQPPPASNAPNDGWLLCCLRPLCLLMCCPPSTFVHPTNVQLLTILSLLPTIASHCLVALLPSITKIVRILYPKKDLSTQLIDVMSFG
jgi:hypothetical protein